MTLSEERIGKNYLTWVECLKKYDCYSEQLIEEYGELIKNASFSTSIDMGACQGSLIHVILTSLCLIGTHINECAFGETENGEPKHKHLFCNKNSLMKVLLLQHISKAEMFVACTEQWKIQRGNLFEFNNKLATSLKLGERSLFICQKCGIKFTEDEYKAMKCLDDDENKNHPFVCALEVMTHAVNRYSTLDVYRKYKQ